MGIGMGRGTVMGTVMDTVMGTVIMGKAWLEQNTPLVISQGVTQINR